MPAQDSIEPTESLCQQTVPSTKRLSLVVFTRYWLTEPAFQLLLPEIRMTVSNLSQAIHFLVENEFLQDVELNPGDADDKPIEVISESTHDAHEDRTNY